MIKFIVDTQLPPKLAEFLQHKGFDSVHTTYFPNGHLLEDVQIVELAVRENRIVISKDSDFLDNFLLSGCPPKVLLIQFGNLANSELLNLFENGTNFLFFSRSQ